MPRILSASAPEPSGTGYSGGGSALFDGRYDRKRLIASIASSSVSTTWSAMPLTSACTRQPPSSSASTALPIAIEMRRGLDTATIAPLRKTQKSDIDAYHADEPKQYPSAAAAHGDSRRR